VSADVPGTSARSYDEFRDLSAWSVEQYLQLTGWTRLELVRNTYGVWARDDESASLLLPYDQTLRDYRRRFREATDTLTAVTGLESEALALEIVAARKDVFLLRADQSTSDGSIPFLEARRLIAGVETLLTSAAATTVRPRASTAGRKPALVTNFMRDDVRMGHTLHGSFVITVLASDGAEEARRRNEWEKRITTGSDSLSEGRRDDDEELTSFPRQVMSTLASGLRSTNQLTQAPRDMQTVDDAVTAGVTAQMLEAVQDMSSIEGLRALDMAFKWSKLEPIAADMPTRVLLDREESKTAGSYIESFTKQPDVEQDTIIGQVVRLDRSEGSEDGQVVVDGVVGKRRRRVKVPLSGEEYRRAIAAHDQSRPISFAGTFERRSRGWRMALGASITDFTAPPEGSATNTDDA